MLDRNFAEFVVLDLAGIEIPFARGYLAVDATIGARDYRFVNTHLEVGGAFGSAIQALQAPELIATFADEYLPLIVVGDFNASPLSPPAQAYAQMIAAGYADAWPASQPATDGFTCCFSETLDDPAGTLSSRIDHIFFRYPAPITVSEAQVLGDEPGDFLPVGLWPSDHAGVFAALQIPVADTDGDGLDDLVDNCIRQPNPVQRDTDSDGFGNYCDADFNQDGQIDFADLAYFRAQFMGNDPDADLDGDGNVGFIDLAIVRMLFFGPPGPAA